MKTNVTYIDACHFENIIAESGLPATLQKGFVRVDGPKGRRLYVASTKRVGRVDISGFEVSLGGQAPHCGPFGNVKQQLDMSLPQEEVLENFRWLLVTMASLPAVEKPARKPAAAKADAPKGWTGVKKAPAAPKPDRLARIKKAASSPTGPVA